MWHELTVHWVVIVIPTSSLVGCWGLLKLGMFWHDRRMYVSHLETGVTIKKFGQ